MKRFLTELAARLAMSLAITSPSVLASPVIPFSFYGTWRIDALTGYSNISANPDDLEELVGQTIVISGERFKIGSDDCSISHQSHVHELTMDTTRMLRDEYGTERKDVGIPARTQVLVTESCGDVFRAGDDIVVSEGGAFFRASRVKPDGPRNRKP